MNSDNSHTRRTIRGANWNLLRVAVNTLLNLAITAVLARLLPPEDFGLLALALVFVGIGEMLSSLGMGSAIIQRKVLTRDHLRVAFTLSLGMGTVLMAIFVGASGPIAGFFHEPELRPILVVLGVGLWMVSASSVSRSILMRDLDFKRLFVVDLCAYLAGFAVVSITLALLGVGVWSLVLGHLSSFAIASVALLAIVRPPIRPLWRAREVQELFGFGSGVTINGAVNYLAANIDNVVIGRFLSADLVGLYNRAYQLVTLPLNKVSVTLSSVLFPAYSEIQDHLPRLEKAYLRAVSVTALVTFPVLAGFLVAGDHLIVALFGENWRAAGPAFRILCIAGLFKAIFHLSGAVAQATGRVYSEVARQLVYLVVLLFGCLGAVDLGIEAIAAVVALSSFWLYLSMAHLTIGILQSSWRVFLRAQLPGLAAAAVVGLCATGAARGAAAGLNGPSDLTMLMVIVATSALAFALALLLLPRALMGGTATWLAGHYLHLFPRWLQAWLRGHYSLP